MKKYTLAQIAGLTGATLKGDPQYEISGVDSLETATGSDASFLTHPRYLSLVKKTKAGVVCLSPDSAPPDSTQGIEKNLLISEDPSSTFQQILNAFLDDDTSLSGFKGIHPTALIHPSAHIGDNVHIGPYVVIDQGAVIGDYTTLLTGVFVGPYTQIASHCLLYPHVCIRERCHIGNRVIIQPGSVIGSCGFGFNTSSEGVHTKLQQLGTVLIEDDVEIGANTTIDRARFKTTRIGKGTKIDNLVQIGHNVDIGEHNLVVSQTGIAGSVKTGRNVVFGGQAGIVGHIEITDHVLIAARGGVSKSIHKSGKYSGAPVLPLTEHNRQQVLQRQIISYTSRLNTLEKKLKELEEKASDS